MTTESWMVRELVNAGVLWGAFEMLRVTLVLLIALGASWLLRGASAGARHLVWAVGVLVMLTLPVLSGVLPWQLHVVPVESAAQSDAVRAPAPPLIVNSTDVPELGGLSPQEVVAGETLAAGAAFETVPARAPRLALPALLAVWLIGVVLLLGRLFTGWLAVRRLVRNAVSVTGPDWTRPLLEGADRMDLREVPRVVVSSATTMPFACGILQPTIVVPGAAETWGDGRRRAVLLHELAHVRRSDVLLNLLGRVACALYWFHPLVWVAARQLRAESERACDDLVLATGARPSTYADHLLQIACRAGRARTPAVALPMAQRREFEGRMLAILEAGIPRNRPTRRVTASVAMAALALALPLAALAPAESAAEKPYAADPQEPTESASSQVERDAEADARADAAADADAEATAEIEVNADAEADARGDAQTIDQRDVARTQQQQRQQQSAGDPVAALLRILRDDADAKVRMSAAWSLAEFEDPRALPGLAEAVTRDPDAGVRGIAAWALGEIEAEESVSALSSALSDDVAGVRLRAAWALGQIEPAPAPAALIAAVQDPANDVRVAAIWALGQIEDDAALPAIGRALESSTDAEVRRVAIWAIGSIGGELAGELMIRLLEDPDPAIRAAAARGLAGAGPGPWPWPWPMPGGPH